MSHIQWVVRGTGTPTYQFIVVVYYNGESERQREEMRWCRCYEAEVGEDISLYEFVYYESIKRDLNKRLKFDQSDGGRVAETEESLILSLLKESICICERGE